MHLFLSGSTVNWNSCSATRRKKKEESYDSFHFQDMMDLDKNGRILSRGLANVHHVNDTTMVRTPSLLFDISPLQFLSVSRFSSVTV